MEGNLTTLDSVPLLCKCGRDVCNSFIFTSPEACEQGVQNGMSTSVPFDLSSSNFKGCADKMACCCENYCTCSTCLGYPCGKYFSSLVNQYRCQVDRAPPRQDLVHTLIHPSPRHLSDGFSSVGPSCSVHDKKSRMDVLNGRKTHVSTTEVNGPKFSTASSRRTPWQSVVGGGRVKRGARRSLSPRLQQLQLELEMRKHESCSVPSLYMPSCSSGTTLPNRSTFRSGQSQCMKSHTPQEPFLTKKDGGAVPSASPQSFSLQKVTAPLVNSKASGGGKERNDLQHCSNGKCVSALPSKNVRLSSPCPCHCACFHCTSSSCSRNTTRGESRGNVEGRKMNEFPIARNGGSCDVCHSCEEKILNREDKNFRSPPDDMQQESASSPKPVVLTTLRPSPSSFFLSGNNNAGVADFPSEAIPKEESCPGCAGKVKEAINVECHPLPVEGKNTLLLYLCCSCGLIWGPPNKILGAKILCGVERKKENSLEGWTTVDPAIEKESAPKKLSSPWYGRKVFVSDISYLQRRAQLLRLWEQQGKIKKTNNKVRNAVDPNNLLSQPFLYCSKGSPEVAHSQWKIV